MPWTKDLNIEKRFCNLKNFNEGCNNDDDGDDDDSNNNIGHLPGGNLPPLQYLVSLSRRDKPSLPLIQPVLPASPLNVTQRFLLRPQNVAEAIGQELTATRLQKIALSDKILKKIANNHKIINTIEEEPSSSSFSENYVDETDVQ